MIGGFSLIIYDLNQKQIKDIESLYKICNKKERLTLELIPAESKLFYIQYIDDQLICFASCIISDNNIEIRGITHPDFRRKGYFRQLIKKLKELYPERTILFPWDGKCKSARLCYEALEAKPEPAEYLLRYLVYHPFLSSFYNSIELMEESDEEYLALLHSQIFNLDIEQSRECIPYFSQAGKAYRIVWSKQTIGMYYLGQIHVSANTKTWYLYAFGILPRYRNKGLALHALEKLNHKLKEGEQISVQVSEYNKAAFQLYKKFGFSISQTLVWYVL